MNPEEKEKEIRKQNKHFEELLKQKPKLKGKIWFWLTCLRPVTKIEHARMAQSMVQNRRMINQMIMQLNSISLKIAEMIGFLNGKNNALSGKVKNNLAKNLKKKVKEKKDDIMYR